MHAIQRLKVILTWLVHLLISSCRRLTVYKLLLSGVPLNRQQSQKQCNALAVKRSYSLKSLTNNEVFKLIKSGTIKSCSLDPLPASIMAKYCHALLPMRTRIINLSLATSEMPMGLKCAMLRPFLKKPTADHKVFANFRPVSNLKYISKLIEKAVAVPVSYTHLTLPTKLEV